MLKDIHTSIRKKTIIDKLNKQQKKTKKNRRAHLQVTYD